MTFLRQLVFHRVVDRCVVRFRVSHIRSVVLSGGGWQGVQALNHRQEIHKLKQDYFYMITLLMNGILVDLEAKHLPSRPGELK